MLVKREIIITGDNLNELLKEIKDKSLASGYGADDHFNDGFHCLIVKPENHDDFSVDCEAHQLRVWPGPPCEPEETSVWNEMLSVFFERVIKPVCAGKKVDCHITEDQKAIEEFFSDELARLLKIVVKADSGTSSRWRTWASFLVKAKLESGAKYSSELYQWLEDEGVDEKTLKTMINDFELANWILDEYFRQFPEHQVKRGHPET